MFLRKARWLGAAAAAVVVGVGLYSGLRLKRPTLPLATR